MLFGVATIPSLTRPEHRGHRRVVRTQQQRTITRVNQKQDRFTKTRTRLQERLALLARVSLSIGEHRGKLARGVKVAHCLVSQAHHTHLSGAVRAPDRLYQSGRGAPLGSEVFLCLLLVSPLLRDFGSSAAPRQHHRPSRLGRTKQGRMKRHRGFHNEGVEGKGVGGRNAVCARATTTDQMPTCIIFRLMVLADCL